MVCLRWPKCLNAVVLADVDLPYWTSGVNLDTAVRFADPDFVLRVQNFGDFGDLATFSVEFCILYSECPPYFYFRFV